MKQIHKDDLKDIKYNKDHPRPQLGSDIDIGDVPRTIDADIPPLELVTDSPFEIEGIQIEPLPIWHGKVPILGFRFGNVAYITDCSRIDPEVLETIEEGTSLIKKAAGFVASKLTPF